MSYKFFYLYLIGGFVALAILIYEAITDYAYIGSTGVLMGIIPSVVLFYLAYKVWHEKNDSELM
ncbi:MAG: hypothetical protein EOP46_11615 [Sphingobacteriaceae bacterium]|nr:MAG: hypothetical protein EOP46_11615 [Sphingobacteriaceae bacterium]